jgi:hypothetical protein
MALSIVATLREHGEIHQEWLAASFAMNYDPFRGYGTAMHRLLPRLRQPGASCWREEARALLDGGTLPRQLRSH